MALIVAEVALAAILLVGAGLMIRSFGALLAVNPGYETENLLTFQVALTSDYREDERRVAFYNEMKSRLESLPGVESMSMTSQLFLSGSVPLRPFAFDEETARDWESVTADEWWIGPGFFKTVGATLISGREFLLQEAVRPYPPIVIDDTLQKMAFGDKDAVGELLQVEPNGSENRFARVVGVVQHLRQHDLRREALPQIYAPALTSPDRRMSVVVRTSVPPAQLSQSVKQELRAIDPGVPVQEIRPVGEVLQSARGQARMTLLLMAGFGVLAITLACIGIYGVISFWVSQRTQEMGVRLALGAVPSGIRRLVVGQGMRLVILSITIGGGAALLLARAFSGLFYGVDPLDLPSYAVALGLLLVVAWLACWIPARRAAQVDPVQALRSE